MERFWLIGMYLYLNISKHSKIHLLHVLTWPKGTPLMIRQTPKIGAILSVDGFHSSSVYTHLLFTLAQRSTPPPSMKSLTGSTCPQPKQPYRSLYMF